MVFLVPAKVKLLSGGLGKSDRADSTRPPHSQPLASWRRLALRASCSSSSLNMFSHPGGHRPRHGDGRPAIGGRTALRYAAHSTKPQRRNYEARARLLRPDQDHSHRDVHPTPNEIHTTALLQLDIRIIVGAVGGWLASIVVTGGGFGLSAMSLSASLVPWSLDGCFQLFDGR
jgi:hypothetical protein